jgi:hypothetical protein
LEKVLRPPPGPHPPSKTFYYVKELLIQNILKSFGKREGSLRGEKRTFSKRFFLSPHKIFGKEDRGCGVKEIFYKVFSFPPPITLLIPSITISKSCSVIAALSEKRILENPSGTVGGLTAGANTFSARNFAAISSAFLSSPTRAGTLWFELFRV